MSAQISSGYQPTNVVQFPASRTATNPASVLGEAPDQLTQLKAAIEALSSQLIVQNSLKNQSSPFDPIYLSALLPDEIPTGTLAKIHLFATLEDRSDQLSFEDGLD